MKASRTRTIISDRNYCGSWLPSDTADRRRDMSSANNRALNRLLSATQVFQRLWGGWWGE